MSQQEYAHLGPSVQAHGAILSLTFSRDGKILATGGDDCHVRTWSVTTKGLVPKQVLTQSIWGPITTMTFIYNRPPLAEKQTILCFGAARVLAFCEIVDDSYNLKDVRVTNRTVPTDYHSAFQDLRYDPLNRRLAVSFRDGTLRVYHVSDSLFDEPNGLTLQSTVTIPGLLTGVRFKGKAAEQIILLGISGSLMCLDASNCKVLSETSLGAVIGCGAFSKNGKGYAVLNLSCHSFQLYRESIPTPFASPVIPHSTPNFNCCVFAESDAVLITASDHGLLYVFSTDMGAQRQTLEHTRNVRVQLIEACRTDDGSLIASVACQPHSTICLFRKDKYRRNIKKPTTTSTFWRAQCYIVFGAFVMTLCLAIGYREYCASIVFII
ncbi:WD40-repeat-containing domain protein [Mycena floridula]|nr:WD40-repeat-containing domain protein [Mycena floridula]